MINSPFVKIIILITVTLAAMWALPAIVRKATSTPQKYPFTIYSSIIEQFCYRESDGKNSVLRDATGKRYTEAQFDSILPMLYYRQLSSNGVMPDSIRGQAVTLPEIRRRSFNFRYNSYETSTPRTNLYVMYEALPKRLNLESPDDVFRMKKDIEFIDVASNEVNREKSDLFANELARKGFVFPAQWTEGILSVRKPYDEGYFSLDAKGKLFHIKMVNNRPFVRNTQAGDTINIAYFSMLPVPDKRFYGFLFDTEGYIYMLEAPRYDLKRLDMHPINMKRDNVMIMANMFFWTVNVITPEGRHTYALHNDDLQRADETFLAATPNGWDKVSRWLFPAYVTLKEDNTKYIKPRICFTGWEAFSVNIALALSLLVLPVLRGRKRFLRIVLVLLTGIAGFVALLIVPSSE